MNDITRRDLFGLARHKTLEALIAIPLIGSLSSFAQAEEPIPEKSNSELVWNAFEKRIASYYEDISRRSTLVIDPSEIRDRTYFDEQLLLAFTHFAKDINVLELSLSKELGSITEQYLADYLAGNPHPDETFHQLIVTVGKYFGNANLPMPIAYPLRGVRTNALLLEARPIESSEQFTGNVWGTSLERTVAFYFGEDVLHAPDKEPLHIGGFTSGNVIFFYNPTFSATARTLYDILLPYTDQEKPSLNKTRDFILWHIAHNLSVDLHDKEKALAYLTEDQKQKITAHEIAHVRDNSLFDDTHSNFLPFREFASTLAEIRYGFEPLLLLSPAAKLADAYVPALSQIASYFIRIMDREIQNSNLEFFNGVDPQILQHFKESQDKRLPAVYMPLLVSLPKDRVANLAQRAFEIYQQEHESKFKKLEKK